VKCSLRHDSVRCSRHHLRHSSVKCSLRHDSVRCSRHHLRQSNVRCNRLRHSSERCNRRHLHHSSGRCNHHQYSSKSSRPHRVRSPLEFRSLGPARSSKVNAVPAVPPGKHLVRFRHSSRLDSPPLPHRRCDHRLRRLGPRRHRRSAPSCHLRHRITRAGSMTCAAPAARCARATVS
jgi:hypothetical protein